MTIEVNNSCVWSCRSTAPEAAKPMRSKLMAIKTVVTEMVKYTIVVLHGHFVLTTTRPISSLKSILPLEKL